MEAPAVVVVVVVSWLVLGIDCRELKGYRNLCREIWRNTGGYSDILKLPSTEHTPVRPCVADEPALCRMVAVLWFGGDRVRAEKCEKHLFFAP